MTTSAVANFDPYHKWLGIRDADRPPNHYRLLGIELFETDVEIIEDAASRQMTHLRKFMRGPFKPLCMQVLEELYTAKAVLLDRNQRATYDRVIKQQQQLQGVIDQASRGDSNRDTLGSGILSIRAGRGESERSDGDLFAVADDAESCPECGWDNPATRQFCSGCGLRLSEPCLSCGAMHGVREKHCGKCGLQHATALRQQIVAAEAKIMTARTWSDQLLFDRSETLLKEVAALTHPRLAAVAAEAAQQLPRLAQERARIVAQREQLVSDATAAFASGQIERAATLLENIPQAVRDESIEAMLGEVRDRQIEILSLQADIRVAVAAQRYDGLLPKVERMLVLVPNHSRSLELKAKLEPYQRSQAEKQRVACIKSAQQQLAEHDYAGAVKSLERIPKQTRVAADKLSLETVRHRAEEVSWLQGELTDAVEYDTSLLPLVQQLLKFTPRDEKIRRYASTLQAIAQRGGAHKSPAGAWPAPPARSTLGFPISRMTEFLRISHDKTRLPEFGGAAGGFSVAAGLALQGVRQGPMLINLLPVVRRKFFGMNFNSGVPRLPGHAAWGLDIGSCALKAIKLGCDKVSKQVSVLAAERIEHRQPLGRGDGNALEIIVQSLKALQAKHRLDDAPLCLGVSGQLAFSRFFQLPLMEEKKVGSVMQYEAASQIPFKLDDVIWDYQVLHRHDALRRDICEREMALFAIRREHLTAAMAPLAELGLRPAIVQSQAAALHNLMIYDRLSGGRLPGSEDLKFDGFEPAVAVLDVGGEGSNLVISGDGASWCRCVPLGGQQFSQALVEANQFTFSQAEKWKRNQLPGVNLHQTYQVLQPVLEELVAEVRRSVDYYLSSDRQRKIVQMLVVGNAARLPGLMKSLWLAE